MFWMIRKASDPFVEEVAAHEVNQGKINSRKRKKKCPSVQAPLLLSRCRNNFRCVGAGKPKCAPRLSTLGLLTLKTEACLRPEPLD
jgi:hypothetical protein